MKSITQKNLTNVIGDFHVRSSKCWTDDKATPEGLKTGNLLF